MAFADPLKGEPPEDFRANDSYRDNLCRWEFFMLNYRSIGVGGFRGVARRWGFTLAANFPDSNLRLNS